MNSLIMQLGAVVSAAIEAAATAAVQNNNAPTNQSYTSTSSTSSSLLSSSDSSSTNALRLGNPSQVHHRSDASSSVAYSGPTTTTKSVVTAALMEDGTVFTTKSDGGSLGYTMRPVTITTSSSIVDGTPRVQVQAHVSQSSCNRETLVGSPTGSFKIIKSTFNGNFMIVLKIYE